METFNINRNIAHLAILQRIELASPKLKKIRKLFGRYLFTKFFSKYFINVSNISTKYYDLMYEEFSSIKRHNVLQAIHRRTGLELEWSVPNSLILQKQWVQTKFYNYWKRCYLL